MKKKLGLTQVCEILLRQNLITAEQKDSILLKEKSQKNKLTKLNALKNNASELTCKDILPSDIIMYTRKGRGPIFNCFRRSCPGLGVAADRHRMSRPEHGFDGKLVH